MTFKNLYLGLKDQMPLMRFLRNLKTGNVLGLFFKRSHITMSGKPKVMYNTQASALKAAVSMEKKNSVHYSTYKCIFCNGYHIGRNRENK